MQKIFPQVVISNEEKMGKRLQKKTPSSSLNLQEETPLIEKSDNSVITFGKQSLMSENVLEHKLKKGDSKCERRIEQIDLKESGCVSGEHNPFHSINVTEESADEFFVVSTNFK